MLERRKLRDASDTFGLQKAKPSALSTFGGGTESQKLQMTTGMKVLTALKTLARALPYPAAAVVRARTPGPWGPNPRSATPSLAPGSGVPAALAS